MVADKYYKVNEADCSDPIVTQSFIDEENMMKNVDYADKYWNSENSDYASFDNDCTNYASQVLEAGGYSVKAIPSGDVSYFDCNSSAGQK